MFDDPIQNRIAKVFFPNFFAEAARLNSKAEENTRFVHYTSAESAANIIKSDQVWLRNSAVMNDFSEIHYGLQMLQKALESIAGSQLKTFLDDVFPGLFDQVIDLHRGWQNNYRAETYLFSICEHKVADDAFGRLSMWRAYGSNEGVAVVLNRDQFLTPSDAVGIYTSPVLYADRKLFEEKFRELVCDLEQNRDFIKELGAQVVLNQLFDAFKYAGLCTKHPAFEEEREWRMIYNPSLEASANISLRHVTINGLPQIVAALPFKYYDGEPPIDASFNSLIDRILIGPGRFPSTTYNTFIAMLREKDIPSPEKRLHITGIPLRV